MKRSRRRFSGCGRCSASTWSRSTALLGRLQRREVDLGGIEGQVAAVVQPNLLAYNSDWVQIDAMLDRIMAPEFRAQRRDSFGGGWIYTWHCVDHVGYLVNPRRRTLGHHAIFDHYRERLADSGSAMDGLGLHFHPMPVSRQANHSALHWFANGTTLFEILARRIIERGWFPAVHRPGFHVERQDSHWFLEQFIPFDYGSQALRNTVPGQCDMTGGRFGDWRRAPRTWQPYHPAHDDYQRPGSCRRWIMRCLNVGTRAALLEQADVDQAFAEARDGLPVIVSVTDHDFRDMGPDVDTVRDMLADAARRFPEVRFRFAEGRDAARQVLGLDDGQGRLSMTFEGGRLDVRSDRPTFGPQPFLAYSSRSGQFCHDNFTIQEPFHAWSYVFDEQTMAVDALDRIGIGSAFPNGSATTLVADVRTGAVTESHC